MIHLAPIDCIFEQHAVMEHYTSLLCHPLSKPTLPQSNNKPSLSALPTTLLTPSPPHIGHTRMMMFLSRSLMHQPPSQGEMWPVGGACFLATVFQSGRPSIPTDCHSHAHHVISKPLAVTAKQIVGHMSLLTLYYPI